MTAATATPKRRRLRSALIGLAAVVVVGYVGTLLVRREMAARRLAAVIAELDRTEPIWRLDDLEAARAAVPDTENSAAVIDAAFAKTAGPPQALADLVVSVSLANERTPNVRLTPEQEGKLHEMLDVNSRLAEDVFVLAERPRGRYPISYTPSAIGTRVAHIDRMLPLDVRLLVPVGGLAVQDRDVERALSVYRARLNLGRSLCDESLPWSQTGQAIYFRRRAIRHLERLLGHATLSPGQLAVARRELTAEAEYDPWPVLKRAERALADRMMVALRDGVLRTSTVKWVGIKGYGPGVAERVGDWVNDNIAVETGPAHATALELYSREVATAALPWHERLPAVRALDAEWAAAPALARWVRVAVGTSWSGALVADRARLNCAIVAVAVEQYRIAHGGWPTSLADLGEPLPDDPYTGQPLRFQRFTEGVVAYAVGRDGTANVRDDASNVSDFGVTDQPDSGVIGVRLWDVPKRNQPPRGQP